MNWSYWELQSWIQQVDFTIIGSGIVGLTCAIALKERYPLANILILERGLLPQGASTKNAGFACFGSLSEVLDDLNGHNEAEVLELVKKRVEGLNALRRLLGDKQIGFKPWGGYELFTKQDVALFENCLLQMNHINQMLAPVFKAPVFSTKPNTFGFQNIQPHYIYNQFEGQIDTGKMMSSLLQLAHSKGIKILNNVTVKSFSSDANGVAIHTDQFDMRTSKLAIATNGFAKTLLDVDVAPARAQVLITKPIKDLSIQGTFHLDKGYYYFRNIQDRILFGGGRNLDFKAEETTEFGLTSTVQERLETLLKTTILPNTPFEIEHRWSGIMGVGSQKKSIVKPISDHVVCGVRMGGMGVAIGSLIGKEMAALL